MVDGGAEELQGLGPNDDATDRGWFGDLILSAQPSFLTHYHYGYVLIQCVLLLLLLWALTMARDIIMGCPN